MSPLPDYDAVLLTGGGARRMGGVDKPARRVGGAPLVLRVATAVAHAVRVVVVGPSYPDLRADVVTREEPPGGGPVAATAAALRHVTAPRVALLAADLPFLTAAAIDLLRYAVEGSTVPGGQSAQPGSAAAMDRPAPHGCPDVALLVDGDGRDQLLVAVWRTDSLRTALSTMDEVVGASMRRLVATATTVTRPTVTLGPRDVPPWFDCDTDADLARADRLARGDHIRTPSEGHR